MKYRIHNSGPVIDGIFPETAVQGKHPLRSPGKGQGGAVGCDAAERKRGDGCPGDCPGPVCRRSPGLLRYSAGAIAEQ